MKVIVADRKPRNAVETCPCLEEVVERANAAWEEARHSGEPVAKVHAGDLDVLIDVVNGVLHPERYEWTKRRR